VDAALHWQHSTLRAGSMRLAWHTVLARNMGQAPDPALAKDAAATLGAALQALEGYWLASGAYMSGGEDVSLADLVSRATAASAPAAGAPLRGVPQRAGCAGWWAGGAGAGAGLGGVRGCGPLPSPTAPPAAPPAVLPPPAHASLPSLPT
jgi:hypothetical protein